MVDSRHHAAYVPNPRTVVEWKRARQALYTSSQRETAKCRKGWVIFRKYWWVNSEEPRRWAAMCDEFHDMLKEAKADAHQRTEALLGKKLAAMKWH